MQTLSPYSNDATVLSKLSVAEGLTALDENGAAVPVLAKSWKHVDATTWTFELRKAAPLDGAPVTAESVVNALAHANAAEPKPRVLSDVALPAKADDADTVTIKHRGRRPGAPAAPGQPGAGRPGRQGVRQGRHGQPDRHRDRPLQDHEAHRQVKGAHALRGGDVNIAEWIPTAQAKPLDAKARHEVPSVRTDSLVLNTGGGLCTDPALRAAAREAVDGSALVDSVFGGFTGPAQGLSGPPRHGRPTSASRSLAGPSPRPPAQVKAGT
ncbi:ABC transporter substrate-binding protein [Streptomyces brasiliscabiei]|uniref:ABC transporter substrate-binding protein n=1 Tax=Streptomyces brasiliscabiei TaxID=2736302 RepID=A0ABU8G3V7_9ACTN